jgi:hypothetical protein
MKNCVLINREINSLIEIERKFFYPKPVQSQALYKRFNY